MSLELDTLLETALLGAFASALTAPVPQTHVVSQHHPESGGFTERVEPGYGPSPLVAALGEWMRTDAGKAWLGRACADVASSPGFVDTVTDRVADIVADKVVADEWHREKRGYSFTNTTRRSIEADVAAAVSARVVEAVDELIVSTVAAQDVAHVVETRMAGIDLSAVSIEVKVPGTDIEPAS